MDHVKEPRQETQEAWKQQEYLSPYKKTPDRDPFKEPPKRKPNITLYKTLTAQVPTIKGP